MVTSDELQQASREFVLKNFFALFNRGELGKIENGEAQIDVPGKPGRVYVRIQKGSTVTVLDVINMSAPKIMHLPVWISPTPDGDREIWGVDTSKLQSFLGSGDTPGIGVGPHTHRRGFGNVDLVEGLRMEPGLVLPNSSLTLKILPFFYRFNNTDYYYPGGNIDFTDDLPSAGYWRWLKIVVDPTTNTATYISGTDYPRITPLTGEMLAAVNPGNTVPLMGIRLRDTQSDFKNDADYMDCRPWVSGIGGNNTSAPIDATYIVKTANSTLTNEFALGSLATGLLKNTTTTGTPTIAVEGTDYLGVGSTSQEIIQDWMGSFIGDGTNIDVVYNDAGNALTVNLTGQVAVANGGTGLASLTAHAALIGNGTSAIATLAPGTSRNVMISDGTDWTSRALVDDDIPAALTIFGGTVDATPIGSITPSAGVFTTAQVNGNITQLIGGQQGVFTHANTAIRTYTAPDASGTIALTSDITAATALAVILAPASSSRNVIQPTGDFKALVVKGNASQSATLQEWQNSSGTTLLSVNSEGGLQQTRTYSNASGFNFHSLTINGTGAGSPVGLLMTVNAVATTVSNNTALMFLSSADGRTGSTTISTQLVGISGRTSWLSSTGFTTSVAVATAIEATTPFISNSSGTISITSSYGVRIRDHGSAGTSGVTVGTVVGLQIEDQTNGTNIYAIRTNLGAVSLLGSNTVASTASATWKGIELRAATLTLTGSTNVTTSTGVNYFDIARPTITSSNALTVTNAATVYIANSPLAAGSATITNPYALWVDDGISRIDGFIIQSSTFTTITQGFAYSQDVIFNPSSAPTSSFGGLSFIARTSGSQVFTGVGEVYGIVGRVSYASTGAGGSIYAIRATVDTVAGAGAITQIKAFSSQIKNTASTNISSAYNYIIESATVTGAGSIVNLYGLYIQDINVGATLNYAIYTNDGLVHFGDSVDLASGKNITLVAGNVVTDTTTGTKIGTATNQKLSLWNATPDVQPTTAITAAAFLANTSGIVDDTATWGGYTIGQIVAALKRIGALA